MPTPQTPHLRRDIRTLGASFLVLNGMIGAGIFALSADVADLVGPFSVWMFPLVGLFMFAIVLTFGELASYFKDTGGPVLYAREAFGPMAGFQAGWLLFLSRVTALAANANVMADYLSFQWPALGVGVVRAVLLTAVLGLLTVLNVVGVKRAIRAIDLLTVCKLAPLILLVVLGLPHITSEHVVPEQLPNGDDFMAASLLVVYAFVGFETVLLTAGETTEPQRAIPRALVFTVIGTAVLYSAIQLVYVAVAPPDVENTKPLIALGGALAGTVGSTVVLFAAVFSIGGNLTGAMVGVPRITFALAERGSLPRWFGHVHARFSTPDRSVLFAGGIAIAFALTGTFRDLMLVSILSRTLVYGLSIASLPGVRAAAVRRGTAGAFRLPGGYLIPGIGLLLCVYLAALSAGDTWATLGVVVAVGTVLFLLARRVAKVE